MGDNMNAILSEIRKQIAHIIYTEKEQEETFIAMGSQHILPLQTIKKIQDEWVKDGLIR